MFKDIATSAAQICSVITLACLIIKPIREKLFGLEKIIEGQKSILRTSITKTYYKFLDKQEIPEYEKEAILKEYEAYVALGGNSFIQDLVEKMRNWKVVR